MSAHWPRPLVAALDLLNMLPVVYDTAWAGVIDVVGGLSLPAYRRLSAWKRQAALRRPEESIGFRVVARRTAG
jgi:hypothetical protein